MVKADKSDKSCFGIKVWTDTAKLTNIEIAGFGEG